MFGEYGSVEVNKCACLMSSVPSQNGWLADGRLAAGCNLLCARTYVRPALREAGRTHSHFSSEWSSFQDYPQRPCVVGLVFARVCDLHCANQVALLDYLHPLPPPQKGCKVAVLRMRFSTEENVSTARGIIFTLFTASRLPYGAKQKSPQKAWVPMYTPMSRHVHESRMMASIRVHILVGLHPHLKTSRSCKNNDFDRWARLISASVVSSSSYPTIIPP